MSYNPAPFRPEEVGDNIIFEDLTQANQNFTFIQNSLFRSKVLPSVYNPQSEVLLNEVYVGVYDFLPSDLPLSIEIPFNLNIHHYDFVCKIYTSNLKFTQMRLSSDTAEIIVNTGNGNGVVFYELQLVSNLAVDKFLTLDGNLLMRRFNVEERPILPFTLKLIEPSAENPQFNANVTILLKRLR